MLLVCWRSPSFIGFGPRSCEKTSLRAARQLGCALFFLLLLLVFSPGNEISRVFFASFLPWLYLILFASDRFLPRLVGRFTFRRESEQRLLLIGPRMEALAAKSWLEQRQYLGFRILGSVTEEDLKRENNAATLLVHRGDRERTPASPGIIQKRIGSSEVDGPQNRYADLCAEEGIRLLVLADLGDLLRRWLAVFEDHGLVLMDLREEPLEDPLNRLLKRGLDIVVSLPIVLFLLPLVITVARIFQRLQSPGPVCFVQSREGLHDRSFLMYKLRTMHVGDPANDTLPSSKRDPRLYPFGRFLRARSLDEMPQFWNVLRGEMSVVGPRPHLPSYNERYRRVSSRFHVRSLVKPGITGLAQVRGFRGNAETEDQVVGRMESDIEYLENWSFSLDCLLILRTALQMVFPPRTAV